MHISNMALPAPSLREITDPKNGTKNHQLYAVISQNSTNRISHNFASKYPFVVSSDVRSPVFPIVFWLEIIKPKQASKPLNSRVQGLLPPLLAVLPFCCWCQTSSPTVPYPLPEWRLKRIIRCHSEKSVENSWLCDVISREPTCRMSWKLAGHVFSKGPVQRTLCR